MSELDHRSDEDRSVAADVAWVIGTFLVLGIVAGVVWWLLAKPPYYVGVKGGGAVMEQVELGKRIRVDGIFVVAGLLPSLIAGGLLAWRRRDPLLVVLLGTVASIGAGFLALWLGETLGHRDMQTLVSHVRPGQHLTDTLRVISRWVVVAWPFGFLIGAVAVLLSSSGDDADDGDDRVEQPDQIGGGDAEVDATAAG